MNDLVTAAINFRKEYKEVAVNLIITTLTEFFNNQPRVDKLQFFIDVGGRGCTYRDNPIVSNYNLLLPNGSKLDIEEYREILGDLNTIFREAGIGLVTLYGEGYITLCRKDFI